ncbi:hypothetical protein, partial [Pseudomonas aeruginosa]|uniref:hypothetical protein n=1 Tax=Pseudomonas aeruginosa TaxID=287 RepID=UPI001C890CC1
MKRVLMGLILLSSSNITWAEAPSSKYQECLGRVTFEIPEEMEWATYDASRVWQISKGGGHNFTAEVTAVGDNGSYDYDSMIFYVSEKVDKNEFHNASNYIKGTAEIYQDHLRENIKLDKKAISTLQKNKSEEKSIERIKKGIAEMEAKRVSEILCNRLMSDTVAENWRHHEQD